AVARRSGLAHGPIPVPRRAGKVLTGERVDGRDFGGGPASALDGAVHVALPANARVLPREEDAAERPGEPDAQRGIEGRIEEGVPAARPWILFPHDLTRGDEIRVLRSEPVERVDETGH